MAWEKLDNIRGPKGEKGDAGTIGSVSAETVEPGAPARATLTGTTDVHLHLELPRGAKGERGPAGVASSASAEAVPYGEPPEVVLSQQGELVHARFRIPSGAPGVNAVPTEQAVGSYLATPSSASRPGLATGMAQVADDATSDFAKAQKQKLDAGLTGKANLVSGRVPDSEIGASTAATSGTIPKRGTGGRLSGIATPTSATDAANKSYVDAAADVVRTEVGVVADNLDTLSRTAVSLDELVFATRHDSGYSGTSAIVEFTATTATTIFAAPFALEITSVVLSFERYSIDRHATNYVRAWAQKRKGAVESPFVATKTTSTASGGEAIAARVPWSLTAGGFTNEHNKLAVGDLLQVVIGITGTPSPVQYPFNVTVMYRPL